MVAFLDCGGGLQQHGGGGGHAFKRSDKGGGGGFRQQQQSGIKVLHNVFRPRSRFGFGCFGFGCCGFGCCGFGCCGGGGFVCGGFVGGGLRDAGGFKHESLKRQSLGGGGGFYTAAAGFTLAAILHHAAGYSDSRHGGYSGGERCLHQSSAGRLAIFNGGGLLQWAGVTAFDDQEKGTGYGMGGGFQRGGFVASCRFKGGCSEAVNVKGGGGGGGDFGHDRTFQVKPRGGAGRAGRRAVQ